MRSTIFALAALALAACNRTQGECYPVGAGGTIGGGVGGGVINPVGVGGFGDQPTGGDPDVGPDPCNASEGNLWLCRGEVTCTKPDSDDDVVVICDHTDGVVEAGAGAGDAIAKLVKRCGKKHSDYSCSSSTMSCIPAGGVAADKYYKARWELLAHKKDGSARPVVYTGTHKWKGTDSIGCDDQAEKNLVKFENCPECQDPEWAWQWVKWDCD